MLTDITVPDVSCAPGIQILVSGGGISLPGISPDEALRIWGNTVKAVLELLMKAGGIKTAAISVVVNLVGPHKPLIQIPYGIEITGVQTCGQCSEKQVQGNIQKVVSSEVDVAILQSS